MRRRWPSSSSDDSLSNVPGISVRDLPVARYPSPPGTSTPRTQERENEERVETPTLHFIFRLQMASIVAQYPNGICTDQLRVKFFERYRHNPDYLDFGFSSYELMCRSMSDFIFAQKSPFKDAIFFLAKDKGKVGTPEEIFIDTWDKIMAFVRNHGVLRLEDMGKRLREVALKRLDPSDWTLGDDERFYKFCMGTWPAPEPMYIVRDIDDPAKKVIYTPTIWVPKTLEYERIRDPIQAQALGTAPYRTVPTEFDVQMGEEMDTAADEMEGGYTFCAAGYILTPGEFYLIKIQNWNNLERKVMDRMQHLYKPLEPSRNVNVVYPSPESLRSGLYVAAKFGLEGDWHRAIIKRQLEKDMFEIFTVDYGDTMVVPRRFIRYLRRDMFVSMKAQAIRCAVHLPQLEKKVEWTIQDGDELIKLINYGDLIVDFGSRTIAPDGKPVWNVALHLRDGRTTKIKADGFYLERQVVKNTRGVYFPELELETIRKRKVPLQG